MKKHYGNIYTRLTEYLSSLQKNTVDYYIAFTLLNYLYTFPDITSDQIAFLSGTTPSSVAKFCKKIGYSSFAEMRIDISHYEQNNIFSPLNDIKFESLDSYMATFHEIDHYATNAIYSNLNINIIKELSHKLRNMDHILLIVADYNRNIASLFAEFMSKQGKKCTMINRNNKLAILDAQKKNPLNIAICLSGIWIDENQDLISKIVDNLYFISSQNFVPNRTIYTIDDKFIFSSFYFSQKYIQLVFLIINYYILHE